MIYVVTSSAEREGNSVISDVVIHRVRKVDFVQWLPPANVRFNPESSCPSGIVQITANAPLRKHSGAGEHKSLLRPLAGISWMTNRD